MLVIFNAVLIGCSMVIMRVIARDKRNADAAFAVNALQFVALWVTGLVLAPSLGHVHVYVLSKFLWRFIGGGLAFALTSVATYKSLTYVDAAVGTIIYALNAVTTTGLAVFTLHEGLSALQVFGGVILVAAITYSLLAVHARGNRRSLHNLLYGLGYALIAAVFYAIAIVNEKWLLGQMSAATYVVFGWGWQMLAAVVVGVLLQPKRFKQIWRPQSLGWIASMGMLRGVAGAAFVLAEVRSNNVSLVSVIANFRLIIVMILGAWLLKERDRLRQKAVGALASLAGLTMLMWK